jgi:hypothetical protein
MTETINKGLPSLPVPAPSPEIAAPPTPATNPQPKPRPVPKKVRRAIQMMVQGNCRTWAAAAQRVGCARETMYRYFKRPECRQALRDAMERSVLMSGGRASARLTQLLDSPSQRTALDATKLSLQAAGLIGSGQSVSVNVGIQTGYAIDLRRDSDRPGTRIDHGAGVTIVDAEPAEPIAGIGPADE